MTVTIGIPFFNDERYLANAIRSVFAQTYQNWELILVNDGSSDGSLEIARSVDDERVRVISDGQNKKLPARLNQIAKEANGKYLARMDADDLMHPERIEKQLSCLCQNKTITGVTSPVLTIDLDNTVLGECRCCDYQAPIVSESVFSGRVPYHATLLAQTSWFRNNPYRNVYRAEDHAFWCDSFLRDDLRLVVLEKPLYFYRRGGNLRLSNCLRASASLRQIFRHYSPCLAGKYTARKKIIYEYIKSAVVIGLFTLGQQGCIVSRHLLPIEKKLQDEMQNMVCRIISTKVPGFH